MDKPFSESGSAIDDRSKMSSSLDVENQIVASIRRIIRAIDVQSRRLQDDYRLTGPQLATLREADNHEAITISALARAVHLGQPTVSGILTRLERRGLVARRRSDDDRRSVEIFVTKDGKHVLAAAPSLLQERFRVELARLEDWERHGMLSTLERIASMMDAEGLDAAPILETGQIEPAVDLAKSGPAAGPPVAEPRTRSIPPRRK